MYVLAAMSTKMLTLGLYKRRGKYCHIRLAGDNSILVFEEDNLDTKGMKTKNHETLQGQGYVDAEFTAKLIKTEYEEILHVTFPLPSAHSGHSLKSLSDMHSYQPLPEVMERVESFVSNSYLSQISLKLALQEWVTKELIPFHIQKGILDSIPSEFNRHYHPTTQDLRNITRNAINKLRRHTFDQDALGILLEDETKQHTEFQYFLRKYKT